MNYTQLVNRNACLRGGMDEGGTAAADMRQWESDTLSVPSLMSIAETAGLHPEDVEAVLELALCRRQVQAPWVDYANGVGERPKTQRPDWLTLHE